MLIAKVRKFSRHDVIIINDKRYDKEEWCPIDEGVAHEELTIIEEPNKKKGKLDRGAL